MWYKIFELIIVSVSITAVAGINGALIKTKLGLIEGIEERTLSGREYLAFLSVPYAKPPIKNLRFKDPVFIESWDGILKATTLPDYCIQNSVVQKNLGNNPLVGKEDCLYMNIYVPKGKAGLSVMVFLHGGAFYRGGAKEYGPKTLLDEDVILVIPNYRLGAFGFMSTEDNVIPGNFGLKDQNMALKWIQQNIDNFGGNPQKVTVFGQSAGAAAVHYHMLSPRSKGLFQSAILQSGSSLCPWAQSSNHRNFSEEIGKQFGCILQEGSASFLQCMQKVNEFEILSYVSSSVKFYISPNWNTPRIDGNFIPADPDILLQKGLFTKMNTMMGIVRDEGAAALTSFEGLLKDFENLQPTSLALDEEPKRKEISELIYRRYFGNKTITLDDSSEFVEMISDRYFVVCHKVAAKYMTSLTNVNTYLYEFDYKPDASQYSQISDLYKNWVVHGEDLGLLFNGFGIFLRKMTSESDYKMKKMVTSLWANFAKTGNPTPDNSLGFIWPRSDEKMNYLQIDIQPKIRENFRTNTIDWWTSLPIRQNHILFPEKIRSHDEL